MKKFISLAVGMLMTISAIYSQSVTFPENFDGNTVSYTSIPALAWKVDTYYVSPPNAYLGLVPHSQGQEVILESGVYNFTGYLNVYLHFKHICKVSPLDTIRLEYRISGQNWQIVPVEAYQGEALSYASQGFSSASYPQWKAEDSTALPEQSWWKEETFDLGFYVGAEANVQFRFIIKKGNKAGTDISYGWLLDDIEFIGSKVELKNPLVELQQSSPSGDMYGTGPFSVQVKVESKTSAPIAGAKLYYTSTLNGVVTQDTLTMDSITGTSLWTVTLPLFKLETEVTYYVIGMDALGNMSMAADTFTIETNPNLTYEAVSANLDEFISPVVSQVAGGASIPVTVVLHNKGLNDLTTATIHWSVNGQEQNPPFSYTGALPWEFTTQLNLGNYTSGSGDFDTIKVWVSQPNGVANATNANDTIIIVAYGCAGTMGGAYDFGTGGTFTNWNEFKTTIQNCAPASDITLEFISNYTQALDLTNISNLMNGHTLTLTSKSGDASTTTIQVAGTAITLNNSNNIVIKALTINVSSGTSNRYGINFTGACSNVVVRDCRILASASATATTVVPINKTSTALVHNISFIHNEIEGGGRGINFDGGTNISYGTNIVIDSNSIINAASAGIYFRYANSNSMSFNTIKSRSTVSAVWSGIEIYQANVNNINCNRIFSPGTKTYAVRGLFLYSLNWNYTQDTALISNNEISLFANGNSGSYAAGIYFESCAAKVFYNSIHYAGTRTTNYGIYSLSLANILNIRYNNIVLPSSNSAPIYLTGSRISETWDIDYNNFQAPTYVGYALNKNISSTAEWQSIITTDKNTLRIAPVYSPGVTQSLEQANYAGFVAPVHPEVLTDIDGNSRGSLTNMGCYHGALSNTDAMLSDLTGWKTSVLIGQQDSLKAVIWNIGSTALDSIVFQCSVGGVSQTRLWVGSIPSGAIDTITLCNMNYTSAGQYPIEVYIDNLGDMVDNNKANDTLRVSSYVCQGSLSGTKTIGAGVGNDFATIGDAIYELTQCGASNDVIFSIEAGAYPENINLTDISNYTNGYTLTLTSQSNTVGGDVTVSPASGNGITLNNSNRIVLKNLTINVSSDERHGIIFTSGCTNVVIRDCRIIATQTATSATAVTIFKASGTGVVDSLFILHNELDGGYAEIMFDGGVSADYGDCINVDSNTCTNARYAGININYSNINSFSGNTILSRPTPVASWTGISLGNSNGDVVGNRIRMSQHNYSGRMIGINLATHQINYATNKALIANNEIILVGNDANTNAVTTGIILNRVNAKILHNSIFISGGDNTKTPCGLSFSSGYSVAMEIKYNNIVLSNPNGLPIMVGNADRVTVCDIDYNNLYAPNYVWGFDYDGNKYSTIESYREIAPSDRNSFRLPVIFPNAQDLKQNDYTGFSMPTSADVPADIDGENRSTTTHIGCYHGAFPNADAEMRAFFDLKQGGVFGQQHSVNVIVFNGGAVTLDTMVFHLAINNNTPTSYTWTGNLPFGMLDTITIGTVNYTTAGDMNIKAYIANLGTLKTDDNVSNDTLQANIYICATPMVGTKIIGSSGSRDFATIEDALSQLVTCGANGDVIFAFEPGIYPADIDLSGISSCLNGHTLTITSQNGIASEVTITKASGNGIGFILKNSQNIIIRDLTIDLHLLTSNAFGINFQGACSNITIRGCHILSDPTAINQLAIPIYKENATGRADNISIVDNVIEGGGYGIYFYAGSNSTNYGVNIRIDSNTIKDAHPSAILIRYTDFKSIFANTFISRATQTSAWLGLDLDNCNGDIIGNRFDVPGNSVSFGIKGMSLMSHNALVPNAALIYNNELLLGSTKGPNMWGEIESYGILFAGTNNAKVMYNSIYFAGNVANHGFRLYSGTYNQLEIKYNNVVMAGNAAYPFYSESANINVRDIDYNNFYAPQYVASTNYGSNNIASIAAWQTAVSTDKNSVRVLPVFVDGTTPTASLKIQNKDSLQCPLSSSVVDDIEGKQRYAVTQMGAYTSAPQSLDMALWKITNTNAMSGYLFDIEVEASNLGLTDIDTALLKWSINGNYQGSLLWEASPKMASTDVRQINVGSFVFNGSPAVVSVWVDSVNNEPSSIVWNDTVTANIIEAPLAWFTEPLVADAITSLEFDVHAVIMENSGALIAQPTPELYIETVIGSQVFYDTIAMTYSAGKWSAHVPQQYYGSKVVYSLFVSDTNNSSLILKDSTFIQFENGNASYAGKNLSIAALHGLDFGNTTCLPDFTSLSLDIVNTGNSSFDFSQDNLAINLQITQPFAFSLDTLINTGVLSAGEKLVTTLVDSFYLIVAGEYDFAIHINIAGDNIGYDDTLIYDYVSGRFGLPIDESFNGGAMNVVFNSVAEVGSSRWSVIPQGSGSDSAVLPQFGDGVLAFNGSVGSITRLYTRQLDLSGAFQPSLSFSYFHDTVPCDDYMNVMLTIDGGDNYTALLTLQKEDLVYGWRQYNVDLPFFALQQCVFIVFEAMERDRSGQTWQYIDRILITDKQDIAITDIILPELTACDLENKEVKVVLSNLLDAALDYDKTPTTIILERLETGETFTYDLDAGSLSGKTSDTITVASGYNFVKGAYTFKAYFTTLFDVNSQNDTLEMSSPLVINPVLDVNVHPESAANNCLSGEFTLNPTVTLYNKGNMDLSGINIILRIDTGGNTQAIYTLFKETYSTTLLAGDTVDYTFTNSYNIPWNRDYDVRAYAYLSCDSALVNSTTLIQECVNTKDLRLISIDNSFEAKDTVGDNIQITATLNNRCDYDDFPAARITVVVENSLREEVESFTETQTVGLSATISHTFNTLYTVPDDSVYYLTVFVDSYDNYPDNDTTTIRRETVKRQQDPEPPSVKGIDGAKGFTLSQNIPNPAKNSTHIDYSIPEAGQVIFHIHSVSGQLLYSKTIEAASGKQSLELNTNAFAAGIYFYSIEYKGQRLVKRMMISD